MKIYQNPRQLQLPQLDVLTFLFESEHCAAGESTLLHCDAADPANIYNKAECRTFTKRLAHVLRSNFGIGARGAGTDVVTVVSSGQSYLPIAFYGVVAARGVYSAASPSFTVDELVRQIRDGDSSLIIASKDVSDVAIRAAVTCNIPLNRVLILESTPVWRLYDAQTEQDVIANGFELLDWERITDPQVLAQRPIVLIYSSGTTGPPKGVALSNRNLVAETFLPHQVIRDHLAEREKAGDPPFEWRTLAHLPSSHIAGLQGYFLNPFYSGALTYWMPKFDFQQFVYYCKQYQVTFMFSVPPIMLLLAKSPAVTDHFKTVRSMISGAAPMGAELQAEASAKIGDESTAVSQLYGLSETTGTITYMPWDRIDLTGSVAPLIPNVQMRLLDDDGKDVAAGQRGEIAVKGPVVFIGYHNRPAETAKAFLNGWFLTGDIGEMRGDLLYIVDRKKELIKYKASQIAPAELEDTLLSISGIADAAVIGVPWEGTEAPRAYIVADRSKVSEREIKKRFTERLAGYKQLRGGIVFIDAIPKSPSGKILRRELRDRAKREGAKL